MALRWFVEHPQERKAMGTAARAKIEHEWNYDAKFRPILEYLQSS
jgi:hypothetical protein